MHISGAAAIILLVSSAAARTVKYDCKKTPQICLNTCWAIKCKRNAKTLHGGGQRNALESWQYNIANRNRWGYRAQPCSNGWGWTTPDKKKASSPDEYPYASSKEAAQPNYPKVVALRCVPLNEKSIQGVKLEGLGTDKKSGNWTTKWVNINKLPRDWCGPRPSCRNDGHQFISGGPQGPFKLDPSPKKVRDIGSYSEDGTSAWVESRDVAEDEDLDEVEARDVDEEVDEPEGDIEARETDDETDAETEAVVEARDDEEVDEPEGDIKARETDDEPDAETEAIVEARDVDEEVDEPEGDMEAREADDETETTAEARDVEVPFES